MGIKKPLGRPAVYTVPRGRLDVNLDYDLKRRIAADAARLGVTVSAWIAAAAERMLGENG